MQVIVVGGGIGGLTTALCLHKAGFKVDVYEAAPEIKPLGVGINVLPHAVDVLAELGSQPALAATAIHTKEVAFYNQFGQYVWHDPRGLEAGYSSPQFSIHRGQLQMILYQAALKQLGPEHIHLGCKLTEFSQNASSVHAVFTDPLARSHVSANAQILIAADGIHSAVRRHYHPNEGMPKWTGIMMWRGVTYGKPFLSGRTMVHAGHARQKFVVYPISGPAFARGEAEINWIADVQLGHQQLMQREDWNRAAANRDFAKLYQDWRFDWLDIPDLIARADRIFEFPMVDRDPLKRWTDGRVTLLGDAAHPMYPIGSNGASQSILDAKTLVEQLLAHPNDPLKALAAYEAIRLPATARLVEITRREGFDQVIDQVQLRAPNGFQDIEQVMPFSELSTIVSDYKKLAGHQVHAVAKRYPAHGHRIAKAG
jgi:5-methylphenazine-1-carboxylate 1-monooxygenase